MNDQSSGGGTPPEQPRPEEGKPPEEEKQEGGQPSSAASGQIPGQPYPPTQQGPFVQPPYQAPSGWQGPGMPGAPGMQQSGMPGAPMPGQGMGPGMGPGVPGGMPGPGMGGPMQPVRQGPSGLSIAAFVLSLAGVLCGLTAIPGFIIGLIELGKIRRGESPPAGKGFSIAAIIISAILMALFLLYILILIIVAISNS